MIAIAPSILSADFTRLGQHLAEAERGGAQIIHVDVMDGHFVPNITIGPFIVEAVRRATGLPIDAHLMIEHPDHYIADFARAGANMISVHPEAVYHLHRTLALIRSQDCQSGLVLNPGTPLSYVDEVCDEVDYVLLMSVNPGFGGQKFIASSLDKVKRLRALLDRYEGRSGRHIRIEIDGGVGTGNIAELVAAGVEIFVAGSAVFGTDDPAQAVRDLLTLGNSARKSDHPVPA
jgi:ribulose-phosphate 3-epimerase